MSFWVDDLDVFFSDFGEEAIWSGKTFKVLFHNEYEAVALFDSSLESRNPYLEVKDTDIEGIVQNDVIRIGSVNYNVVEIKPDGTGITVLELAKV